MRIKSIIISNHGLDTPIRFPAPTTPGLRVAPDLRLTKDIDGEEDELVVLEDERKANHNFGGKVLC
jgi:hypothetical protein